MFLDMWTRFLKGFLIVDNRIVLRLMYDTEKVTFEIIKEWCEAVCQCFEPEKMMHDGKRTQYSKDSLYEYLETNITTDKMSLALTKDKNKFSIVKDDVALRTVTLSINLLKEQTSEPVDRLIDKYMAKDGIVAYKCTMEDFFWQNETSISSYTCRKEVWKD